jgi:chromosome segregation ATPase
MIDITENDTEYLLSIPPSEKERAKTIKSYSWDSSRRVWVYPRTAKNYDALVAEFGDDLTKIKITRPSRLPENEPDTKSRLDELTKRLESIAKAGENTKDTQVKALQATIQKYEKDAVALNEKIASVSREFDVKNAEVHKLTAENSRLKNDLDTVISDSKKRQSELKSPTIIFEEVAKLLALELIEKNGPNAKAVQKLQLSERAAIDISKLLEQILRKVLKADASARLNDLINQARDSVRWTPMFRQQKAEVKGY